MKHPHITEWVLRYQNQVRLPRDSGPQRQVSGMTAHHFDDLHPTMRSRGCARTLEHFRYVSQCGVKTECVVSAREILVDCFRHAHNANTSLGKHCSNTH